MSKWKCDICKKEFDNFHAQGFDNKIYCPLCFFKEKTNRLQQEIEQLKAKLEMYENGVYYSSENDKLKEVIEEAKDMLDLIIPELWNVNNAMTYKVKAVRRVLDKAKENK